MKQLKTTLIALPLTVMLAACSGDGGSNDTTSSLDDDSGTVTPSTVDTDSSNADEAPEVDAFASRQITDDECGLFYELSKGYVKRLANYPDTYRLLNTPQCTWFDASGKPEEGAIGFRFQVRNGFNVPSSYGALCPLKWKIGDERGYWTMAFIKEGSLDMCWIVD